MKKLIVFLVLFLTVASVKAATNVTLVCDPATNYTDGSPLLGPVSYRFYTAPVTCVYSQDLAGVGTISQVSTGAWTYVWTESTTNKFTNMPYGLSVFYVTVLDSLGSESEPSSNLLWGASGTPAKVTGLRAW